jgi:hypothetical protein
MRMKAKHCIAAATGIVLLGAAVSCRTGKAPASTPRALLATGSWVTGDAIKTPLKGAVQVLRRPGQIVFLWRLHDADGARISYLELPGGRPNPPKITVRDAAGKVVHTATMEYG